MLCYCILLSLLTLRLAIAQDGSTEVKRNTVSVPIGTIFPKENAELESSFKAILRNYNVRAPVSGSVWSDSLPVLRFQALLQNAPANDSYKITSEICNHVWQRAFTIFGRFDEASAGTADSYSSALRIPWIHTGMAKVENSLYITSLFPPLARPVLAVTNKWKCNHMTYFYDMKEVHITVEKLMEFSRFSNVEVKIINMNGSQNILPQFRKLSSTEEHVIIFDVGTDASLRILGQLDQIGMLTAEYHYVFTDLFLPYNDLSGFTSGGANITLFSIMDDQSLEFQTFQMEYQKKTETQERLTHEGALMYDAFKLLHLGMKYLIDNGYAIDNEVRREISRIRTLKGRCHDLPASKLQSGFDINQAYRKVKFQGLTGQVQLDEYGRRVNYSVNILTLSRTGLQFAAQWVDVPDEEGLGSVNLTIEMDHETIWNKFLDETLVITTILEAPYVSLKSDAELFTGNEQYEGFCVDLLQEITKIVPLKYKLKIVEDGNYGSEDEETGLWDGMIGEVKYNKAHMAVAPLTITSAREAVVDFTKPFMTLGISIMIKKPEKEKPHIFSFLEPLAKEIWICIVFAYIGVSVVLFIVSRFSPYEWHRASVLHSDDDEECDPTEDFGIFNSLWFSLGTLMQQGADNTPKSFSGRLVSGVWWFFTLIIVSSYTANLAAFLTIERMGKTISGVEDLAKQSDIKYGTLEHGSTASFFKHTPISIYEKMWNFMNNQEPSVFVEHNMEGIERVRNSNGKYAFLMESTLNDYTAQRKPCNTMKVGANLDSKGYGIALPKGSPIYDDINLAILNLSERGYLQKLKQFWWYDKSQCLDSVQSKRDKTLALGLENVAGVFYVLMTGLIVAIFTALLEYLYKVASTTDDKRGKIKKKYQKCIKYLPNMNSLPLPTLRNRASPRKFEPGHAYLPGRL